MSCQFLCLLLLPRGFCTPPPRVSVVYVPPDQSDPVLLLTPSLKSCKSSGTSPIRALDIGFHEVVDHSETLPEYTPLAIGPSLIPRAPTPASASQVIGRRLHQVHEGIVMAVTCSRPFLVTTKDYFFHFSLIFTPFPLFRFQHRQNQLFYFTLLSNRTL